MIASGSIAPDFELSDEDGKRLRLSELVKQGPVVLYFYPADFTPICTLQACAFRDLHAELARSGVRVLGVSPQTVRSHQRFRARFDLPYPLLSDPKREVARAYGAVGPFGLGVRRLTYWIGSDGRILDVLKADFLVSRHKQFVKRVLDGIRASNGDRHSGESPAILP